MKTIVWIAATQQPLVELTSGDWEGIYADNSGYVREAIGGPTGGYWHLSIRCRPGFVGLFSPQ